MLYRLDILTQVGVETYGNSKPHTDFIGTVLFRTWAAARAKALELARHDPDGCVLVTRIGPYGTMSIAADVYPDGRVFRHARP